MEGKNPGYSVPVSAPLYPEPPYLYRGGNSLICVFRANVRAIESLVPEPLKPAPGGLVYGWQNDFHAVGLGSYHEAIISIPVEFEGKPGQYMAYMYLDSGSRDLRISEKISTIFALRSRGRVDESHRKRGG